MSGEGSSVSVPRGLSKRPPTPFENGLVAWASRTLASVYGAAEDTECPSSAPEGFGSATCVARKERK